MLNSLYVKNLALVDEVQIEFAKGLNIMTGETGAGKSIILGAINLALGGKAGADIIGRYGDSALVELEFTVDDDKAQEFNKYDIFPEDGVVTISRRIMANRSVYKVNGETMNATGVRNITELLIDIHGQHDHQSLLYKAKHLEILDRYGKAELESVKAELAKVFQEYRDAEVKLKEFTITEEEKARNISFLEYERDEIVNADIHIGEDVETEALYHKIINAKKITEQLDFVAGNVSSGSNNASDLVSRSLQAMSQIAGYDEALAPMYSELTDIENLINDFARDLSSYMSSFEFDERIFRETEHRLDIINNLKAKHGGSVESILDYLREAEDRLAFYEEYEDNLRIAREEFDNTKKRLFEICEKVTSIRTAMAKTLSLEISEALNDLNFSQVQFEIDVRSTGNPTANGMDEAEFMISLNAGESIKPLAKIASGGELSRIMLGIKSVLAGRDEIDTLIFDEIDTGISGRTAQKVSEKMAIIAQNHQIICITHLPQIAAMADSHYLIEKSVVDGFSKTSLRLLSREDITEELSRMLGGTEITDIVRQNAIQMKSMADEMKKLSV